ncbi:MAG: autotransporter-associated beta strand repeat-containing protein, partial [Opitutales bacterium]|nr:autotransporter-associated beta strand repeat-containing protein [Opitutales bacterium]
MVYTPMADDAFMSSFTLNGSWLYRTGNGGTWRDGNSIYTGRNSLGGVVNLSVCWQDSNTGEWYLEGWARKTDDSNDWATPLDIGVFSGDSGSPYFAWDDEHNQFVFVGALWAGGAQRSLPNWYLPRYNYRQGSAVMEKYTVVADKFSGTEKIVWGEQDAALGTGTLTQGENSVSYTGKAAENTVADTLGLTFSTDDAENEQHLELAGSVNMGAGALTFESGKWKLSEADSSYTLASAGFEIKKGTELTLELTGTSSEEIRKVGEGTLTVAGSGNNESALVVGGGTTIYNVTKDADGNITGCSLGNAGETRLNRTGGYAASSVRLEGGVAIVVLMQDNQFKTNTTAGDTFSFGNDGGLLNLNGHNLEWGVINQNGSGAGARIGNFTPLNETTPGNATFTYTGTGTFAGSFTDEGANGAQLAVKYSNSAEDATWTLTGNSSNVGGFTVEAGTMKLEGAKTPHVNFSDANDWRYASIETSKVSVQSGATFQLSHHALLKGDVDVATGGNFVMNQTVNAASESVSGSLRQDMAKLGITSLIGNVSLSGNATMTVNTTSPVATTIQGNISGDTSSSTFTKTGSGLFVVNGQVTVGTGTVEAGGIVVKDKENFTGTWTIRDAGYLGVEGMNGDAMRSHISADSTGVLALGADQTTAIADLGNYTNLYIGALGTWTKAVEYGVAGTTDTLSANSDGKWLLGGGGGTLNVNFRLTGESDLIIGNDYSSGTVHLTNTANDFSGDIYIEGTGNMLTYVDGALGVARVALTYGNTLGLNNAEQLSILKDGAQGILALTKSQDLDLSGKTTALGAYGELTYAGTLSVSDKYRFGGSGNLTLDTTLSGATEMELDGQGNSGSSVTFARENAFTGTIVAGGGLYLDEANSAGDISIHVAHAGALASVSAITMQKGASLDTDGRESLIVRNLSAESGTTIKNSGNTATLLQLDVSEGKSVTVADGVLLNANNNASISIVKTGAGTLTMGANSTWNGGLTIMEGTVKASVTGTGLESYSGGIGSADASIYVNEGATLHLTMNKCTGYNLAGGNVTQKIIGTGTVRLSSGGSVLFSATSNVAFEGFVELVDNTRLWVGSMKNSTNSTYDNLTELSRATIVVNAGSQARVTNALRYGSGSPVSTTADFVITGTGYTGAYSTSNGTSTGGILQDSLMTGALGIDNGSTVYGNITLADNATIASESKNAITETSWIFGYNNYGVINKLGGTIRGKILGEGKTLTFGGNEGMTITADSANTFGDLIIANGNGNNDDKFALRLDGGATKSQTSTALGTGSVTLGQNLILRLAGTGTADNSRIVYTYQNAISAGEGATLQSYNITNR